MNYEDIKYLAHTYIYIIRDETTIFAQQRLPFKKALVVAAYTFGKVRASTEFMSCSVHVSISDFYYSSKTDSWGRSLKVTAPR